MLGGSFAELSAALLRSLKLGGLVGRVGVSLAGVIVTQIPDVPAWIGLAIMAAANVISAGERNVAGTHESQR